eukprot:scaffold521_cov219-Skeletonema_menzelii.AAC.2
MAPRIDGNETPGPSRGQGAGAGCDGSTTAAITAERMAEKALGLRKCSLLSIHLLALVFEVLIGRVDFHLLQAAFLDSTAQHVLLVIECSSVRKTFVSQSVQRISPVE